MELVITTAVSVPIPTLDMTVASLSVSGLDVGLDSERFK